MNVTIIIYILLLVSYFALGYIMSQAFWRLVQDLHGLVLLWHDPEYDPVITTSIIFWVYFPFVALTLQGNSRTILSCVFFLFVGLVGYLLCHPALMIFRGYVINPNYSNFVKTFIIYQQPLVAFILSCLWYNDIIEPMSKFVVERM